MLSPRRTVVAAALAASVAAAPLVATPAGADEHVPCHEPAPTEGLEEWMNRCYGDIATGQGGGTTGCVMRDVPWWGSAPVRCSHPQLGFWSNREQCYLRPAIPPPPADHPAWDDRDPADGLVYQLSCPYLHGVDGRDWRDWPQLRFYPAGEGGLGRIVDEAIGRLDLAGPDIHLAPGPDGAGLVGLPVWMWTTETPATWGPQRLRLPALGWELVVEATVDRIEWEMGDGNRAPPCDTPGTPYQPEYGARPSPDCGYDGYQQPSATLPGSVYTVTATAYWRVDWWFDGTAVRGSRTTTRQSSTTLRINELQVVTS